MGKRLEGKIAIVTGASSGNGRAIALAFAREGAKVICSDLQKSARQGGYEKSIDIDTDDLIRNQGGEAQFIKGDVTKSEDVQSLVDASVSNYGRLDIIVNNAGVFTGLAGIVEESEEAFDLSMAVNTKGVWLGCKFAITQMLEQNESASNESRGKIINIASIGGLVGLAQEPAYCASKGAVVNLTKQLAVDYAPSRINVNAICPGFLATAMVRPFLENPELNKGLHDQSPWPTLGTAEDVAKAAVFLASDESRWVSGSSLVVDGGFTAR
ncbi:short-chain dehydrogenase [Fictibacillus arsenicus]|uniref:Short-chain dehydrogenase n=1 Tax=Fictibacillus arsenicus TaxID=255247 RepID=A0A1B1Z2W9_9BACL|nr:glucose 1-dehydrogenase [Fictibacillus arsenicus]ANX11659.1 short-chain dehydrogenase [Fictibacillus arsenicus]